MRDTTANTTDADTALPPVLIFTERPRCPDCGGVRLLCYKTTQGGDGSTTRRCRCAECGRRVHVVLE